MRRAQHLPMSRERALSLLGLPTIGATRGDLAGAFRRLASLHHPDHGGNETRFLELLAARDLLAPLLPPGRASRPVAPRRSAPRVVKNPVPPATLRIVEGPLREADVGRAQPNTTSYPQEIADFTPWDGADWTGASSGLAWVPNPREYADPRRHGPSYRARGRRQR